MQSKNLIFKHQFDSFYIHLKNGIKDIILIINDHDMNSGEDHGSLKLNTTITILITIINWPINESFTVIRLFVIVLIFNDCLIINFHGILNEDSIPIKTSWAISNKSSFFVINYGIFPWSLLPFTLFIFLFND